MLSKRYRSSVYSSGEGFKTSIPKRMLRFLKFNGLLPEPPESYNVVWALNNDGSLSVKFVPKNELN